MAVRAFDRAVLVRHAAIVAGRLHPVMGAQRLVAPGQILARIPGVEIAERRRQAVAAMLSVRAPPGCIGHWRTSQTSGVHHLLRLVRGQWPPSTTARDPYEVFTQSLCRESTRNGLSGAGWRARRSATGLPRHDVSCPGTGSARALTASWRCPSSISMPISWHVRRPCGESRARTFRSDCAVSCAFFTLQGEPHVTSRPP